MLQLHTIKPAKNSKKKRKRVGRGNASGHGTYSTRGLKGQKSRSGGKKGLKRLGMKQLLLQQPKVRGFKSKKAKNQVVDITAINLYFKDGDKITPRSLLKAGLIKRVDQPVKILGKAELKLKNLSFIDVLVSKSVAENLK